MKKIGLIGGMGSESSLEYYGIINEALGGSEAGGLHDRIYLYMTPSEKVSGVGCDYIGNDLRK